MTAPAPATLEREKDKLFVSDAELIRLMGVPEKIGRAALQVLDANKASGFPRKQKLWGDRRHWPSVKAYFERQNGMLGNRRG
jgi:hypothetical protein